MNEFLKRVLSPAGMTEGHGAVVATWEWFTHASARRDLERIKAKGIELKWPDGGFPPEELIAVRGYNHKEIVCLSIYPKNNTVLLSKGDWLFKMALHRDDLPKSVGIDCTFGSTYEMAARWREEQSAASDGDIFREVVRNREVVISYEPIAPGVLRVCPEAAPDAPLSEWPRLVDTVLDDVALFGPPDDVMGYVAV